MKNILITGGAGFIGSRLCEKLYARDYNITVLDNLSEQIHGNQESDLFRRIKGISTFIKGDVRNRADWERSIKGQDIIVHLAAETGTGQSMYEIERYNDVNIMGTSHLLKILEETDHSIKRIVLASSRAIYGEGKYNCLEHGIQYPLQRLSSDMENGNFNLKCQVCNKEIIAVATDERSKIHPLSIYGETKQKQEEMIMLMGSRLNIPSISFRYQNVYGPGQSLLNPYTGILSVFSTRILNGNDIDIYEDGLESRDFVYIDDVVEATILGIEKEEANGEVFNVGSGISTTVKKVAESLKNLYGSNIDIAINRQFRLGDIRHNFADLSKINSQLGFIPQNNFDTGIIQFVNWVKDQDIMEDRYENSIQELKDKGIMK